MLISASLSAAIKEIQPKTTEIPKGDVKALYALLFEQRRSMRSAGIRLREYGIDFDYSAQGEGSKWECLIHFPLSIIWEATLFEGSKVTFAPKLYCRKLYDSGKWVFNYLQTVLAKVEPIKEGFLKEPVCSFPSDGDIFYTLESEVSSRAISNSIV